MIRANDYVAAMSPYALAAMQAAPGKRLIALTQNESPIAPSPQAIEAGLQALRNSAYYPDPDWRDLRTAICNVHALPPEQILCGAGSMELIACLFKCFAGPGDEVLASQYAYAFFRSAASMAQADYVYCPEIGMTVSVDHLLAAVTNRTRIVCIANPGNPTGTRISSAELTRLRDGLPEDILLVIDEAYGEFAGEGNTSFQLVKRGNCVVARTFSKAYGLAGLRCGWGVFPPEIAEEVRKLLNPNNVSIVSQAAATAAMHDQAYMKETCRTITGLRDAFARNVRRLGLVVPQSTTNFVLIVFDDAATARRTDGALRSEGIALRGMAGYGLENALRATIGAKADMDFVLEILSQQCSMREV